MGIERKNCVMPLELAMKRELTCREKLQRLTMVRGTSSNNTTTSRTDGFLLSQVSIPASIQTPSALLIPSPNPCLSPGFFPHQRLSPSSGSQPWQAPQPRPTSSMPLPTPPSPPVPAHSATDHHLKRKERIVSDLWDFFCDICDVDCISEFNLRMHVKGQKHTAKLEEVRGTRTPAGGGVEAKKIKRPHCELCGVYCIDHFSLWQHLLGRNHILKLLGSDKEAKGTNGVILLP
uniref:C2H2-type domain-containing protein n=1 Tax=Opuntia streptacantha TaxID=393608 RepID=A0A7C9DK33_OPUST